MTKMNNIDLLKMVREQLVHLEEKMKGLDSAFRPVFNYPLTSNVGMLELINMAIEDNREQELVTRLYNLKNQVELWCGAIESIPMGDERIPAGMRLALIDADETLKKVIQ